MRRGVDAARLTRHLTGIRHLPFDVVPKALLRHESRFLLCLTAMVRAALDPGLEGTAQSLCLSSADLDVWLRIARRRPIGYL